MLTNLVDLCATMAETHVLGECHVAMALCRPGRSAVTMDDLAWETGLRRAFALSDATWSLHLAADGAVTPLAEMPE